MGITDIFGDTFNILRGNPRILLPYLIYTFLVGGLVLYFVFSGIAGVYGTNIFMSHRTVPAAQVSGSGALSAMMSFYRAIIPLMGLVFLVSLFISPLLIGTYIGVANQGYRKRRVSLKSAFEVAKKNYLNLLVIEVLVGIIWIVALVVLAAVFLLPLVALGAGLGTGIWFVLGIAVSVVVVILLAILFYQAYAVAVLEKAGAVEAIKRSIAIGRQNKGNIFVLFLVSGVIVLAYSILISILQVILEFGLGAVGAVLVGAAIAQIVNFTLSSGMAAWFAMVPVGFYKGYVQKPGKRRPKG